MIIQLILIWIIILINTTMSINQFYVIVPKEMLVHGPININFSVPDTEKARMSCNPHFKKFISNSSYFLDAFGEDPLTTVELVVPVRIYVSHK